MTHADVYDPEIRNAVEAFVREGFGDGTIVSISFEEDCDCDGQRILEITIMYKGTAKEIARREPPGFLRGLRDRLYSLQETAFPVVSFKAVSA